MNKSKNEQVVVIGGGIAGLTTALELERRGISARVIEGTSHRGGRICSVDENGGKLETGMEFYYGSYREARRLLKEFGLLDDLVPIHLHGLMYWQGRTERFNKSVPWLRHLSVRDNLRLQAKVARRLFSILALSPFDYRAEDPLDEIDCAEHFTRHGDDAVLELAIRPMVNSYAFCEPEGHSLAMLLRILKLGGTSGIYGLKSGNDALPRAIAQKVNVTQGWARQILIDGGEVRGVLVDGEGGEETIPASRVVCAVGGPQASTLFADSAPAISAGLGELSYSTIVLANLHLDRAIEGPEWTYIHSRKAGHRAAFAIDLARRAPAMFPEGKAMIQVNFASPTSDELLGMTDDDVIKVALDDMEPFLPGIAGQVGHTSVVRRARAHPNFRCGMFSQVRQIQQRAGEIRGLHLAGDYLRSPLCEGAVRSALAVVEEMGSVALAAA